LDSAKNFTLDETVVGIFSEGTTTEVSCCSVGSWSLPCLLLHGPSPNHHKLVRSETFRWKPPIFCFCCITGLVCPRNGPTDEDWASVRPTIISLPLPSFLGLELAQPCQPLAQTDYRRNVLSSVEADTRLGSFATSNHSESAGRAKHPSVSGCCEGSYRLLKCPLLGAMPKSFAQGDYFRI
jgi:hypothetical protein